MEWKQKNETQMCKNGQTENKSSNRSDTFHLCLRKTDWGYKQNLRNERNKTRHHWPNRIQPINKAKTVCEKQSSMPFFVATESMLLLTSET